MTLKVSLKIMPTEADFGVKMAQQLDQWSYLQTRPLLAWLSTPFSGNPYTMPHDTMQLVLIGIAKTLITNVIKPNSTIFSVMSQGFKSVMPINAPKFGIG